MANYFSYATTVLFSMIILSNAQNKNKEIELINKLMRERSDKHSRPVYAANETMVVVAFLRINHIQELDEARGVLTINGWLIMHWKDQSLAWDPKENNVNYVRIPTENIWTPDIHLINNAEASNNKILGQGNAFVASNGRVYWIPTVTLASVCDLDFTWFPMDIQTCVISLASWLYTKKDVNLTFGNANGIMNITTDFYEEHNQWELISTEAKHVHWWGWSSWPILEFSVQMRRRAPYYHLTFVIPCIIALMLTIVTFWLPPTASERLSLGVITNTLLTAMLIQLYWVVPRSGSSLPGIVILCGNMAIFSIISFIISIISLTLNNTSSTTPVPNCIENLLQGWLGTVLCLKNTNSNSKVSLDARLSSTDNVHLEVSENSNETGNPKKAPNENKWFAVATMLDRVCFIVFCFSYFIILLAAFT